MEIDFTISGLAILAFLYSLFFVVGAVAVRFKLRSGVDEFLLAGRDLPLLIGICTMVATWVGGGFINGTAEAVADPARGLVWAQAPWGYAVSLILGGFLFAGAMRKRKFRTILDLFESRYGRRIAAGLYLPALMGEVFWSAAILAALGTSIGTLLGISFSVSIVVSAAVAIGYTLIGGLRSVAYSDFLQLFLICLGLGLALPFALNSAGGLSEVATAYLADFGQAASPLPPTEAWTGPRAWGWQWADWALLLVFGGIPWQVYFQRVLACRTHQQAVRLSVFAGFGCFLLAIPAALMGAVGGVADWNSLGVPAPSNPALILPWVLRYLTPPLVGLFGLAAIGAAVMSSVDSSILSAASMFSWNVYRPFRPSSEARLTTVTRIAILLIGSLATSLALKVGSVYTLWALCADTVYVILFPQLLMGLYYSRATSTGAVAGALAGLVLRLGGGEPLLGLPSFIPYPMADPEMGILFPFRTTSMLASIATIWLVSEAGRMIRERNQAQ